MSAIMNILAASMHEDMAQLQVVARNVANANVVAYRQRIAVPQGEFTAAMAANLTAGDVSPQALAADLPSLRVAVDPRPGTLKHTGQPLDVAIQGDGYFVVSTPQGELLTRRGDFHLDASGTLCAFNGDPIVGAGGQIQLNGTPRIQSDGTVLVGNQTVGRLDIVRPAPGAALQSAGDGLFATPGGQVPATAEVHQGFLETSNVSPVNQMVALLQTTRHFESTQRFVLVYDQMLQTAIDDLGKA